MKNIYYTEADDMIFWVAGYTHDDNTSNLEEKIKSLNKEAKTFQEFTKCDFNKINTYFITKSSKYKYMRMFYVKKGSLPIKDDYFILNKENNWNMWQWIQN